MRPLLLPVVVAQSMTAFTPRGVPERQIGSAGVVEGHAGSQTVEVLVAGRASSTARNFRFDRGHCGSAAIHVSRIPRRPTRRWCSRC
jgi:hypothetical protein